MPIEVKEMHIKINVDESSNVKNTKEAQNTDQTDQKKETKEEQTKGSAE